MGADPTTQPPSATPPRRRKWRRRLVVYTLLFVAYNLVMSMGCADNLILHPSREPVPVEGAKRLDVPVGGGSDGAHVEVWIGRSAGARFHEPEAFILQFIGNADRAEYSVVRGMEQWADRPVEIWAVNYPGFGGSSGRATMKASAAACVTVYDVLRAQAGNRPIIISGLSFGTAAGLHVAANRPVAAMVLQNPPPLRQLVLGRYGWWNLWLVAGPVALGVPSELDSIGNAAKVKSPAVFILASADEIVPPEFQQRIVQAYAGENRSVSLAGAGHNDLPNAQGEREIQTALDWLWSRVAPSTAAGPATTQSR